MNLSDYPKLKKAKRAALVKVNKSYAMAIQRMNPDGSDGQIEMNAIGREDIARMRLELEANLALLDEVAQDMDKLDSAT